MQWLRSLLFTGFMFAWTGCYSIFFTIVCGFLPFGWRFKLANAYARAMLAALKWTCGLDYRVEGRENIVPGAHVALWKHSSSWETFAMQVIFPPQAWVLKRELMWIPFFGWALGLMRGIAIDRSAGASAVNQVVDKGLQRIRDGIWVIIFPEGTRVAAGEMRRFGVSGALLAAKAGCKVVPVAHDAGLFWPRRGLLKKPGVIRVKIGPPIEAAHREARAITAEAQAWIENAMKSGAR